MQRYCTDASLGLEYNLARGIIASVRGSYELGRLIGRWLDLSCARLTGLGVREQSYNFSPFHFPSIRLFFTSSVIKIGEIISRFATIRYDMVPQRCTFFFLQMDRKMSTGRNIENSSIHFSLSLSFSLGSFIPVYPSGRIRGDFFFPFSRVYRSF